MHHAIYSVCEIWICLYFVEQLVLRGPLNLLAGAYFEVLLDTFFRRPPQPANTTRAPKPIKPSERPPQKLSGLPGKEVYDATFLPHPDKAPGVDGISFRAWRHMFPVVKDWIKAIYQRSMDLRCLPTAWKVAKIVAPCKPNKPDYTAPSI